jgi:hypothetical protein
VRRRRYGVSRGTQGYAYELSDDRLDGGRGGAYVRTKSIPTISGSMLPIHIVELSGEAVDVYPDTAEPENGGVMSCDEPAA